MNTRKPYLAAILLLLCIALSACNGVSVRVEVGATVIPVSGTYPPMPGNLQRAPVVRVVDGDTLRVRVNGVEEAVRLIGINTPESVDPQRPVECFGKEASAHATELLTGKTILLEIDPSQDTRDRYGRLLRYVWFEDGRLFNLQMIREGYAYEYTYDLPYKYQKTFKAAQQEAEQANRGLWSPQTCSGQ